MLTWIVVIVSLIAPNQVIGKMEVSSEVACEVATEHLNQIYINTSQEKFAVCIKQIGV